MIENHILEIGTGLFLGAIFVLNRLGFVAIGKKKCNNKCPDPACQACVHTISADVSTMKSDQAIIKEELGGVGRSLSFVKGRLEGVKIIQVKEG